MSTLTTFAPAVPLPTPTMRRLYDGVEALRVAWHGLDAMYASDDESLDDRELRSHLPDIQAVVRFVTLALEQHVDGVLPTVSDRAFKAIRTHVNRCPRNCEGAEAVLLAMQLAHTALDDVTDALWGADGLPEGSEDFYASVYGACETIQTFHGYIDSECAFSDADEVLAAILAGKPAPPISPHTLGAVVDIDDFSDAEADCFLQTAGFRN